MLIEVKVKVARRVEDKVKKKIETYIIYKEFFSEAEYAIMQELTEEQKSNLLDDFEVQSLKLSTIKEIYSNYTGNSAFVATLKDIFLEPDGTEKTTKYKILLWADSLTEATKRTIEVSHQGYSMTIESLKEVDWIYVKDEPVKNTPEEQENIQ